MPKTGWTLLEHLEIKMKRKAFFCETSLPPCQRSVNCKSFQNKNKCILLVLYPWHLAHTASSHNIYRETGVNESTANQRKFGEKQIKTYQTGLDTKKVKLHLDKQPVAAVTDINRSTTVEGRKQAPKHLQNSILQVFF